MMFSILEVVDAIVCVVVIVVGNLLRRVRVRVRLGLGFVRAKDSALLCSMDCK